MTRLTLAAAALLLAAAPVIAQTPPPAGPPSGSEAPSTTPVEVGSEAWLRQRGETYHPTPDAEQEPAEVAATARLNAAVAADGQTAAQTDAERLAAYERANARWRADTAEIDAERARWEADRAAADAARARYERDRAAWEAEVAACRSAGGRVCVTDPG